MMRVVQVFLVVIVLVNSLGLLLIYHNLNQLAAKIPLDLLVTSIKNQADISAKLDGLQGVLAANRQLPAAKNVLGIADLLPDTVSNPDGTAPTTFVTTNKNGPSVAVYKEQADFSAVLGQMVPDYKYPYYSKADGWYLISLTDGKTGWVKASLVSESK